MASSYSSVYFSSLTHVYPFFLGSIFSDSCGGSSDERFSLSLTGCGIFVKNLLVFRSLGCIPAFFVKFTYLFAYLFILASKFSGEVTMILAARVLHENA